MISRFEINGGGVLDGKLKIKGAKNSILPLLAASVLTDGELCLHNVPKIADVESMINILKSIGCDVSFYNNSVIVNSTNYCFKTVESCLAKRLRSSIFLLGPLLAKYKKAIVSYPGGCEIGARPIDIHIQALKDLGVKIIEDDPYIYCDAKDAKSGEVLLSFQSVGATENLIMFCSLLKGESCIRNAAKEPEIVDLQNMLNKMGAKITGAGTNTIRIKGVNCLKGVEYTPIPDRIALGTYIIATLMCGGCVEFSGCDSKHLTSLLSKLANNSCKIYKYYDKILVKSFGKLNSLKSIETMVYPGFPTDLQPQIVSLQSISHGSCIVRENIFENRFSTIDELKKMGADILVRGKSALINGVERLHCADVFSKDLRGGASLVLAAMVAEGVSNVYGVEYIDRGYEDMASILSMLGQNIKRISE